jgi:hypothetical protein
MKTKRKESKKRNNTQQKPTTSSNASDEESKINQDEEQEEKEEETYRFEYPQELAPIFDLIKNKTQGSDDISFSTIATNLESLVNVTENSPLRVETSFFFFRCFEDALGLIGIKESGTSGDMQRSSNDIKMAMSLAEEYRKKLDLFNDQDQKLFRKLQRQIQFLHKKSEVSEDQLNSTDPKCLCYQNSYVLDSPSYFIKVRKIFQLPYSNIKKKTISYSSYGLFLFRFLEI